MTKEENGSIILMIRKSNDRAKGIGKEAAQRTVGGCETVGGIFLLISELQAELQTSCCRVGETESAVIGVERGAFCAQSEWYRGGLALRLCFRDAAFIFL